MRRITQIGLAAVVAMALAACDSEDASITTTTADASQLTTTTTVSEGTDSTTEGADTTSGDTSPDTTVDMGDPIESYEVISRESAESGETLYILVEPGDYSSVSFENFLGDLIESDTAVSGVEIFDDRTALDAALKAEDQRTAEELQAVEDHHLVSLTNGRQVSFQGPLTEFEDFVIGS